MSRCSILERCRPRCVQTAQIGFSSGARFDSVGRAG